jgi:hypothetical protein
MRCPESRRRDCFQNECNADNGLYGQTLNSIQSDTRRLGDEDFEFLIDYDHKVGHSLEGLKSNDSQLMYIYTKKLHG